MTKPQWGNAAWKAVMKKHEWKRGRPGARICSVTKQNGEPCGNLAMRGTRQCKCHGGYGRQALNRIYEAKRATKANDYQRHLAYKFKTAGRRFAGQRRTS